MDSDQRWKETLAWVHPSFMWQKIGSSLFRSQRHGSSEYWWLYSFRTVQWNRGVIYHISCSILPASKLTARSNLTRWWLSYLTLIIDVTSHFKSFYINPIRVWVVPSECWWLALSNYAKKQGNYYVRYRVPFRHLQNWLLVQNLAA